MFIRARAWWCGPMLAVAAGLLAACGSGSPSPEHTVTVIASSPAATGGPSAAPTTVPPSPEPGIVAVTTRGALEVLDPANGTVIRTLAASGVLGDEISVSPNGSTVYFAQGTACHPEIKSVAVGGGSPTAIAPGALPAISPDGTKLAFARQPSFTTGCAPSPGNLTKSYKLVVRTLATGAQQVLPLPPAEQVSGLPSPISHLSWASDSTRLAVSTLAVQDNEGWSMNIVDTSVARYYRGPAAGVTVVLATGSPNARLSYLREGVFLPDGNLFVSRACCTGVPVRNTSRLMWVVTPGGLFVHQVALGYATLDHVSLAVNVTGRWLLYLAGTDLYVSQNQQRPSKLTSGLIAATWS
jgi:hypothetical protein